MNGGGKLPYDRAAWHFHDDIFTRMTIHPLAHAGFAVLSKEPWLIKLGNKVVNVLIGLKDYASTLAAIAAAGAAFGAEFLTLECDAAFAAVPGARVNFYFVDEHELI